MSAPEHETPAPEPTSEPTPEPTSEPTRRPAYDDPLRSSRTSGAWTAVVVAAVLLVLLVIFILQNTQSVQVSFLGWEGTPPLAVALLVATVLGIVITALVGTLRIWQLRRRVRRERRAH